jgi:hypothetical protein
LRNIVDSLRPSGHLVLSVDKASGSLDFGDWTITLYPWPPERYADVLVEIGCDVEEPIPLIDTWIAPDGKKSETYGDVIATLIRATKK